MFFRRITSIVCIFVIAVVATAHASRSVTGSDLEVTVQPLTTENPDQRVTDSIEVDLAALLDAGDGAVVTLVTGDTRLVAHKAVLTARSPVFAAKLQHMTLEASSGSSGQLAIHDVEGPVLRHLLAYMYTLQAPQLPSIASQLLVAADTYGLSALKAHCEQQVAAQLSVETAVTTAVLAVRRSCSSLMQAAVAFIRTHILQVMVTQGWADMMNCQPQELMKVIRLLPDTPTEPRTPAAATPGCPRQPNSDHGSRAPAAAAAPTAPCHATPPDDEAVSRLRRLSAQERSRRLIKAAQQGAVPQLRALLAAGADVGARDGGGDSWTALHWVADKGDEEAARCLVEGGAEVDARTGWNCTPLHLAARIGHVAVVRLLLAASADPNARDQEGWTPLHGAANNGRAEVVAALLEGGADRGAKEKRGRTPLDMARQIKNQQLIRMLTQ